LSMKYYLQTLNFGAYFGALLARYLSNPKNSSCF